jgi:hypothetical protein
LTPDRSAPLILIKANVCRLLKLRLEQDRFDVLNRDRTIPFPSTGHQKEFQQLFGAALRSAEIVRDEVRL